MYGCVGGGGGPKEVAHGRGGLNTGGGADLSDLHLFEILDLPLLQYFCLKKVILG